MNHEIKLVVLSISSAAMLSFSALSNAAPAAAQEFPPAQVANSNASPSANQNADFIVAQLRTAVHADAWNSTGSLIFEGTVEAKGCDAAARIALDPAARSAAFYAEDGGPANGAEGVDGALAWTEDATGVTRRASLPAYVQSLTSDAYWADGGLANSRWPAQVRYQGRTKLGMDHADILEVTPAGGSQTLVWISKKTHLPVQWSRRDETGVTLTAYADYRNVEGAMVPFQQSVTGVDGNVHKYVLHTATAHADQGTVGALIKMPAVAPTDFDILGARSTTVPLHFAGVSLTAQPYVDVYIDGRGPFNFLVDTGANLSLSVQTAQKIGLPLFGGSRVANAAGESAAAQYAMIADLRIGEAHVRQQNVQVLDLTHADHSTSLRHVDGVVGAEIMERFVSTFDFPNQRLTLSLDSLPHSDLASAAPATMTRAKVIKPDCIKGATGVVFQPGAKIGTLLVSAKVAHVTEKSTDQLPLIRFAVYVVKAHAPAASGRAPQHTTGSVVQARQVQADQTPPAVAAPLV
jgi:hypothetical protein